MFNKFLTLPFIFIFSVCVFAQKVENRTSKQIVDVNFCDLLKNPKDYSAKLIRVKATYRYGFEWSDLYCSNCLDKGIVWIDFTDSFEIDSKKRFRKKIKYSEDGRTVNVVFVGKFFSNGGYGHLGGYKLKFVAQRIEAAQIIYKSSPVSSYLPDEVKAKTYCRTN